MDCLEESIRSKNEGERISWLEKQTYIAMNSLIIACASLEIDACPMEGFEKHKFNQILGLTELGLNASLIVPIGYRSHQDMSQFRMKVRRTHKELFVHT